MVNWKRLYWKIRDAFLFDMYNLKERDECHKICAKIHLSDPRYIGAEWWAHYERLNSWRMIRIVKRELWE